MTLEELNLRALPPGTLLLEKYRVVETIGAGGMGVVVACDHLAMGARVAIKFVLPELVANRNVVQRFLNEARAATRIDSDHVARVLDVGTMSGPGLPARGIPYMVMEYLRGRDLASWIKSGVRFSTTDTIDFAAQAGEALGQAHQVGIIHRDVKPANLFLAEYEARRVVKVLDFGISKILEEEPQEMGLTKTTTVLGSGLYMSPEQMRSAKNVDLRTDIYALGICIYELLTGTHPFTAESFSELCVKVNIDEPTPLRAHRPDVPEELAAAIAKAYARSPADRYASMAEVAVALEPFSAPLSIGTLRKMQRQSVGEFRSASVLPPPPKPAVTAPAPAALAPAVVAVPALAAQVTTERDPSSALLTERNLTATAGALTTGPNEAPTTKTRKLGFLVAAGVAAFVGAVGAGSWIKRNSTATSAATTTNESAPVGANPVPYADTSAASASERADGAPTPGDAALAPGDAAMAATSASASAPATSASTQTPQGDSVPVAQPVGPSATARPAGSGSPKVPLPTGPRPPNRSCKKTDPVTGLMVPCDFAP